MNKKLQLLSILGFLYFTNELDAQQIYRFALKFDSSKFQPKSFQMDATTDSQQPMKGYVVQPDGTKYFIHRYTDTLHYIPKKLPCKLRGVIDYRENDNFFLHFWYFSGNPEIKGNKEGMPSKDSFVTAGEVDSNKEFYFTANWNGRRFIAFPFAFKCISVTSMPVRFNFFTHQIEDGLIDFNMAYFFCWGERRFYKNQDINPRDKYWGVGPFLGVSQTTTDLNTFSQLRLTYGASLILYSAGAGGFNLTPSFGFENGFTQETKRIECYGGLGIGINIASLASYHN